MSQKLYFKVMYLKNKFLGLDSSFFVLFDNSSLYLYIYIIH